MDVKKRILDLCDVIKYDIFCSSCGGTIKNCACQYCGLVNSTLKEQLDELVNLLSCFSDFDNDVLNGLYLLRTLDVKEINDILVSYNYEKELQMRYDEFLACALRGDFGVAVCHWLIFFVDNDLFVGENRNFIIDLLMKQFLQENLGELDIQDILTLIKNFVEMFMRERIKHPKCFYGDLDEDVLGSSYFYSIALDQNEIIEMLKKGDFESILEVIFHECTHTNMRFRVMVDKVCGYAELKYVKEYLLRGVCPGYYAENYLKFCSEVLSRYNGAYLTCSYLKSRGISVKKGDYFNGVMQRESFLIFDDTRTISGVETTVDEAFSMFITDVSVLDRFPILRVQYKNSNGQLAPKTREEILSDYEKYKSGDLALAGDKESIHFLYNYLLGDSGNKVLSS